MDRSIACDMPGLPLEPGIGVEVGLDLDLDCSAPDVLGPFNDYMFTETTLDITPAFPGIPLWIYLVGDLAPDTTLRQ